MVQLFSYLSTADPESQQDTLILLQTFQKQLLQSKTNRSTLAAQEVTDCISDLQVKQQSKLSTSLNLSWLVHEIDAMLKGKIVTFDSCQEQTWLLIKSSSHIL